MRTSLLIAAVVSMIYGNASAETISAATLNSWISSPDDALHLAATSFITGVLDENTVSARLARVEETVTRAKSGHDQICVPPRVSSSTLRLKVQEFLGVHPEYGNMPAVVLVRKSIGESYPCASNDTPARNYYQCKDLSEISYFSASANISKEDKNSLDDLKSRAAEANKLRPAINAKAIQWYELSGAGSHGNAGDGLSVPSAARADGLETALYQFGECLVHGPKSMP